jgi:disulfide bond formation protein DsbB
MTQPIRQPIAAAEGAQASAGVTSGIPALLGATSRHIALLAAWLATGGSLFMSEALRWTPCVMCWYQRILMYPLALLLAIGILRRDENLHVYVLPFSILGALTSLYHYLLIKTTIFPPPPCNVGIPCTVDYIDWFGFINIPLMALAAFLIITAMMVVSMRYNAVNAAEEEDSADADDGADQAPAPGFAIADLSVLGIIGVVVISFVAAGSLV